ncbi:MAG: rhodanese-like domain-containing protein [Deltaproteobacteria bacterium]|nr:rhodanese-like domain-containing protein [Deltaproteobacteria bacterium]MBW2564044.1 rhodanese-like domain-containing protein [Deltaproteobacteria bacterium]
MKKLLVPVRTSLCLLLILFLVQTLSVAGEGILKTISPKEASDLIVKHKNNPDFIILDVRTPREFKSGHIEKAILLDYYSKMYTEELKRLDKTKTYLIYCRSGNRTGKTLNLIKDMGFSRVYNMDKGIKGWRSKGFPVTK